MRVNCLVVLVGRRWRRRWRGAPNGSRSRARTRRCALGRHDERRDHQAAGDRARSFWRSALLLAREPIVGLRVLVYRGAAGRPVGGSGLEGRRHGREPPRDDLCAARGSAVHRAGVAAPRRGGGHRRERRLDARGRDERGQRSLRDVRPGCTALRASRAALLHPRRRRTLPRERRGRGGGLGAGAGSAARRDVSPCARRASRWSR